METFGAPTLITIIAFLIGILISMHNPLKDNYPKLYKVLRGILMGIISSVIGTTIMLLSQIVNVNTKINSRLAKLELEMSENNPYTRAFFAVDEINKNNENVSRAFFQKKLREAELKLNDIEENEILLDKNEIIEAWEFLFENAQENIKASNLMSDWRKISKDSFGLRQHKDAIQRGVNISRVNIFNSSLENHKDSLEILMQKQRNALDDSKFVTGIVDMSKIKNGGRNETLYKELGGIDFSIVDDNIMFIIFFENDNLTFDYAKVIRNPVKIGYAIELYDNLLIEAGIK